MTSIRNRNLLLTLGMGWSFLFIPFMAQGAEFPELITDRPDQTESSETVLPGYFQMEFGWTHAEEDNGARGTTDAFPESLLRVGLVENLELRFGYAGYQWEDFSFKNGSFEENDGCGDTEVGMKLKFWDEKGWIPQTAVLTHLSLPTGQAPFSSERPDPSYRFAFSHMLTERLSLGYNLGQAWKTNEDDSGDRDTRSVFQYTVALGISLTERLGTFVEFFGDIPTGSASGKPANFFNGGFTYLLADNVQLDIASGLGLSEDADDWFIGWGLSFRFPN